jgi:hypothetical protein
MVTRRLAAFLLLLSAAACLGLDPEINPSDLSEPVGPSVAPCGADACAPSSDDTPQTCFHTSRLGGEDFCTDACSPLTGDAGEGKRCLSSGAALTTCDPSNPDCPDGLKCYRTDLLNPKGVCTDIPVCDRAADCPASRPICGGDLLKALYPEVVGVIYTDHLPCFEGSCDEKECEKKGGMCLRNKVTDTSYVPDICVPQCDAAHPCPPNFYCETASGSGYPPICVPGLPGYRCSTDDDCMLGSCVQTEAGFGVCSVTCTTDEYCLTIGGLRRPEVCAKLDAQSAGICLAPSPFQGEACAATEVVDADCPAGKHCSWYNPIDGPNSVVVTPDEPTGECRHNCSPDGTCPKVAGLPHVCLGQGAGGCYPAEFGVSCESLKPLAPCVGELVCEELASPEPRNGAKAICTLPCAPDPTNGDDTGDAACQAHPLTANGFCGEDGFCRPRRYRGQPCSRDAECGGLLCAPSPQGSLTCQGLEVGQHCDIPDDCASSACSPETFTCIPAK